MPIFNFSAFIVWTPLMYFAWAYKDFNQQKSDICWAVSLFKLQPLNKRPISSISRIVFIFVKSRNYEHFATLFPMNHKRRHTRLHNFISKYSWNPAFRNSDILQIYSLRTDTYHLLTIKRSFSKLDKEDTLRLFGLVENQNKNSCHQACNHRDLAVTSLWTVILF